MPSIQYSGILSSPIMFATHIGHQDTLYFDLLLPAIEDLKKRSSIDPLHELDITIADWAKEELMLIGFVSAFHMWERQFREFLLEQEDRPEISIPKQQRNEGVVAYARRVVESYFEATIKSTTWAHLECGRAVVNAFKHGPGRRFDSVMEKYPEYFNNPDDRRHPPMVTISRIQLEGFLQSAIAFWSDLPVTMRYRQDGI